MSLRSFVADMLSDDGHASTSRTLSWVVVSFSLGWVTALVYGVLSKKLSYTLPELATFIGAVGTFDLVVVGALYGVNRASTAVTDIFKK